MQHLAAINETSYLSVPNAGIYRKIMRYFYREYEKMNFRLYKEDKVEKYLHGKSFIAESVRQFGGLK